MKHIKTAVSLVWIGTLIVALVLTACSPSDSDGEVVLKPTTVVADEETEEALTSVTENQEVLNFTESTPQLDGLEVGDVLVMGPTDHTPEGLLRKVTGIDHSGSVVVSTEFATMEDAIEEGTITVNATITAADVQATAFSLEGIKVLEETEGGGFAIPLDITVSGLTFTGELTFNAVPHINIEAKYWPPGLKELEFTIETNESLYIDVEGDANVVDLYERIPLMPDPAKVVISGAAGPIPVVVVIYFTPVLVVEGDLSGQVQAGVEYDAQRKAGLHYKDGDWNLIKEQDTDFNGQAELGVQATLKVSVGAEVIVKFYTVVGPTGNMFGYFEFESGWDSALWWKLYGGLRAELGIEVALPILGRVAGYGPVEVMNYRWLLAESTPVTPSALGEAVDNTSLTWTTGGDPTEWFPQTTTFYYGGDAAQSGDITHSKSTWLQTTVTGPGMLTFYWKVSSQAESSWVYGDRLRFYVNGIEQTHISGSVDWEQKSYSLTSGTHTLEWRYTKDGSQDSGSDCGWVDKVEFTSATPGALGEALDNTSLIWTTGGDPTEWFPQTTTFYYGGDAAQSGDITHSKSTWLQTTVTGPGMLTFYWKVSSQAESSWVYGDRLRFYVNGIEQTHISGSVDWEQKSYSLTSGTHTLEWRYTKDGSQDSGSDCGWVDKVEFAP